MSNGSTSKVRDECANNNESSDSEEYFTAETSLPLVSHNSDQNQNLLMVPRTSKSRNNSELEDDVIISQPASQKVKERKPLVKAVAHNRGKYNTRRGELPKDEYDKPSLEPGEVFIFNFETFPNSRPRDGTRIDVKEIIRTLGCLKYNISESRIYNDQTTEEVLYVIQTVTALLEDGNINCLIVIFLTHGKSDNVIQTKNGTMTIEQIIHAFQCNALRGVPQWYTFLACKESETECKIVDTPIPVVSDKIYKRFPDDILIYFSTTEGNKSARTFEEGTWFIQELCHNLNAYGRRDDIISILSRTNKCIANNYNYQGFRQVPVIVTTLTKKFFLTTSKERMGLIDVYNKLQEFKKVKHVK